MDIVKLLGLDGLEDSLNRLEHNIDALAQNRAEHDEQLSLQLDAEQKKREKVTAMLDDTIGTVEDLLVTSKQSSNS